MQEIEHLCKNIIIINHGIIVYNGSLAEIKRKYLGIKLVDVKLEIKGKKFSKKNCTVVEQTDYEIKVEVDTSKVKVKEIVNYLLTEYDVADILILDPPIEEIIQQIFQSKHHEKV